MIKKIPRKIGAADTTWDKSHSLIGQKEQNTSVNSRGKFFSWHEASRQVDKQVSGLLPSDRYFSFFWLVISTMYVVQIVWPDMTV